MTSFLTTSRDSGHSSISLRNSIKCFVSWNIFNYFYVDLKLLSPVTLAQPLASIPSITPSWAEVTSQEMPLPQTQAPNQGVSPNPAKDPKKYYL